MGLIRGTGGRWLGGRWGHPAVDGLMQVELEEGMAGIESNLLKEMFSLFAFSVLPSKAPQPPSFCSR